jgi:GSCFA family
MSFLRYSLAKYPRIRELFARITALKPAANVIKTWANEYTRWHKQGIDPKDPNGPFACQRLRRPVFVPALTPLFRIDKKDRLFAMGSCFARGIESALKARGFRVESAAKDFDKFVVDSTKKVTALGFTNKYTTYSMLNELRWALDPSTHFPEESLVDLDDQRCIDPHINPTLMATNHAGTLERRRIIQEVIHRIAYCHVVFLTLGLVEVWYDTQAQVHLNTTPNKDMHRMFPGRYEFMASNYLQNMDNMENLYSLLAVYGRKDLQIIVTTSPVPLQATFTGQDIVVANTYSKSTLRAVAQDFAAAHDNVQYFPSYEIVMNSDRDQSWEDDLRHVKGAMGKHVMDVFMRNFVQG